MAARRLSFVKNRYQNHDGTTEHNAAHDEHMTGTKKVWATPNKLKVHERSLEKQTTKTPYRLMVLNHVLTFCESVK